ncbi:DUF3011 domain-containing protein [Pseudoxanthomonas wuyuanensis]
MKMPLMQFVLVLSLAFTAGGASAQAQQRAYAPENLRSLSVSDQSRVIGLEYSEQSNGRRIPDDQLRFYLDQVRQSNWTFSRIKQDIATSLGGNSGGWNPGPAPGPAGSVLCQSDNNRYRECRTNFRGPAVLSQNISQTRCVEGQNWGSRAGTVWVDRGCKGRFIEGAAAGGQTFRCESDNGRYRECRTSSRGQVRLNRQLSSTRCIEGSTWGQRQNLVWVNGGCRGEFVHAGNSGGWNPGAGNYSVTCSSQGGRRSTCAWNSRYGRPQLIQQLSSDSCREGSSWGYVDNQIWVDRGCRARFGVRR